MTDIFDSSEPIQQESVQFNQPVSEASLASMGGAINYLLHASLPPGSLCESMLTEAQFQNYIGNPNPPTWVLADGRDVTGSIYQDLTGQTTIPDLRGIFTRGKNNGRSDGNQNPSGELDLGTYTADSFASHSHPVNGSGGAFVTEPGFAQAFPDFVNVISTNAVGGLETAPKNVTVNKFIRIN